MPNSKSKVVRLIFGSGGSGPTVSILSSLSTNDHGYGIYTNGADTFTMNGGSLTITNSVVGAYVNGGTLNVNAGLLSATGSTAGVNLNSANSTLNLGNGTVGSGTLAANNFSGTYASSVYNGTFNFNGGTLEALASSHELLSELPRG